MTYLVEVPSRKELDEVLRQFPKLRVLTSEASPLTVATALPAPADPTVDFAELAGSISKETGDRWQREIEEMRNEWERDF